MLEIFFTQILPNQGTAGCSPDPVILVLDALHGVVPRGKVSVGGYGEGAVGVAV